MTEQMRKVYRYYTVYSRPARGKVPDDFVDMRVMGSRPFLPEVGCTVWGYVDYERILTPTEVAVYGLAPANMVQMPLEVAV